MIFNTCKNIPEVYSKERDMQSLNLLLDIVLTLCKSDIDKLGDLYNANKCPSQFLPLLAKTLNYEYNDRDTITVNRKILDIFAIMERNKGSDIGIRVASALCLTALDTSQSNLELADTGADYITALKDLDIKYFYEANDPDNLEGLEATIVITYPNIYTLVRYLLDYVRPVGMYIQLRSIVSKSNADRMVILAQAQAQAIEYIPKIRSGVGTSEVNFSSPIDENVFEELLIDMNEGG